MRIVSISEDKNIERRVAITPEIAKKYLSAGFEITLSENYGDHLGIGDQSYKDLGVKISNNNEEILKSGNIIAQLNLLSDNDLLNLKEGQILVGVLNPYQNKEKIDDLNKKKINCFSLELLPRITRAQSMDILSSQANLAGYKAVVESFSAAPG